MMHTDLASPDIEGDYVLWLERQIEIIRERNFAQRDIENLQDELAVSVNKRKRALRSRLRVLLLQPLQCEFQPARDRTPGSVQCTRRTEIEDALEDSPSLSNLVPPSSSMEAEYKHPLQQAMIETRLPKSAFPSALPYTEPELRHGDFIPGL